MPKGQYDRSKTKAQRDAEKKAAGGAPAEKTGKRKYTKRADKAAAAAPALGGVGVKNEHRDLFADTQLFTTLSQSLPHLKSNDYLYNLVTQKLGVIVERLEPTSAPKAVKAEKAEAKEAAPAPFVPSMAATPAPLPYTSNVPVPFNGPSPA